MLITYFRPETYYLQSGTVSTGALRVYLSKSDGSGLDITNFVDMIGATSSSRHGMNLKTGDINGDGIQDLITSAIYEGVYPGKIYIYYGDASFDNVSDKQLYKSGTTALTLCSVSDLNNDGFDDIIGADIPGWNHDNENIHVFLGAADMSSTPTFTRSIPHYQTSNSGDINNNSYSDIIMNTYSINNNANLKVIKGVSSFDINDEINFTLEGKQSSVQFIKDFNGDGINDLFTYIEYASGDIETLIFSGDVASYINLNDTLAHFIDNDPTLDNQIYKIVPLDANGDGKDEFYGYSKMEPYEGVVFIYKSSFAIQTDANYGQLNSSVEIPVTATSELTADDAIYSYQFNYTFDETKLQYTGYNLTGLVSEGGTAQVNTDTPGELVISWMRATPLVGTGDLINLEFTPLQVGTYSLTVSNFKYNETDVTNVTNGDITIVTPTVVDITYSTNVVLPGTELLITATFNHLINDNPVTQIELNGANTLTATNMSKFSETIYTYTHTITEGEGIVNVGMLMGIDEYGFPITYTPTTGATFEIIALTYGDVSDNGEISAYDAALTLIYSVGAPMPPIAPLPWDLWRILTADVDNSEDITATDAGLILQYSVGLIDIFPEESGKSGQVKEGDITVEIIDNEFIFTIQDELLGFNLYVTNNSNVILGEPEILEETMLSATQIEGEVYNIGTCIAVSPASGTQILKIPFTGELTGELIFNMKVNNTDKTVTFGTTEVLETNTKEISIYPNPASDKIQIQSSVSLQNSTVEIYSISGVLINKVKLDENNEIDISNLLSGIYFIKIQTDSKILTTKIVKK